MLSKPRTESTELRTYKFLNARMNLPEKDKQHYINLRKGYEGELLFDTFTEKLQCECLILNDLLLKIHNNVFQIDTLIIIPDGVYLFDVKNFEGDFYFEKDKFYTKTKSEITNPLIQLNRCESLLSQLFQSLGFKIPIHASIVFINPEFTLYQCPLEKPFIFPTQINRYLKSFDIMSTKLQKTHNLLADKLISLHMDDYPFRQVPSYHYDMLQKGIYCKVCFSFEVSVNGYKCICQKCGHVEMIADAIMRSVQEFKLLFPNEKVTTNIIHDWCKVMESKRRISRVLDKNFKRTGVHQWTYFE